MRFTGWLLAGALIVPCGMTGQTVALPTNSKPPQISIQAQHFLNLLAAEDQSEIDLAHLALKKSSNPQVQQYARSKILAADPSMKKGAMRIAMRNNAAVPGYPTSTDKAEYYYLSRLTGKAFDKAYMSYEDEKQNADLIMVKNEIKAAQNPQLKSWVQKEETPVQQAAQSAKQIANSLS
jgi:putative membrane protein